MDPSQSGYEKDTNIWRAKQGMYIIIEQTLQGGMTVDDADEDDDDD